MELFTIIFTMIIFITIKDNQIKLRELTFQYRKFEADHSSQGMIATASFYANQVSFYVY